jgi:hypothetical protein
LPIIELTDTRRCLEGFEDGLARSVVVVDETRGIPRRLEVEELASWGVMRSRLCASCSGEEAALGLAGRIADHAGAAGKGRLCPWAETRARGRHKVADVQRRRLDRIPRT